MVYSTKLLKIIQQINNGPWWIQAILAKLDDFKFYLKKYLVKKCSYNVPEYFV